MPQKDITPDVHPSTTDLTSRNPEGSKGLLLRYYLEEEQPDFTDRLVHGQPVAMRARVKGLKKVKNIEKVLDKPSNEPKAESREATTAGTV